MSEHVVLVLVSADDDVVVVMFHNPSSFSASGSPTTRRSWLLVSKSESSSQASRLKRGRRSGRESESEGGGEEEGRELESTSEQKDPDLEVSPDELNWPGRLLLGSADMLKYLLSCLTAPAMSACCSWGKFHVLSLLGLFGPPYIGSCLIGPVTFFSGTRSGLFCISSRAWMKWHRGP